MKSSGSSSLLKQNNAEGGCSLKEGLNRYTSSVWKPLFHYGDLVVLRRAITIKNYGKHFRGCPNYKGSMQAGCGFFGWFYEDVGDEKEKFWMDIIEKLSKAVA
ncbi:unnamed protein product [Lathyrus sativus]|nr:unnamed protein product [Lathyrus sativus]